MEENELLDFDAILQANYIQEWYPSVKFTVEFKNESSIRMMESTIFDNEYTELDKIYTKSYMSGKVFNSAMFLNIGSKLKSNPFQLKFFNDILQNSPGKSNLMTLSVDEKLAGRPYESVYNEFITNEDIPLLCLGVFTNQPSKEVMKSLK